jgi:uncharacterized protein
MKPPLELVKALLSNPTNIEHVRGLTKDVTYVSLNFDNPDLYKVPPWAGANRGLQSIVDAFNSMGRVWETKTFKTGCVIANEHGVVRKLHVQSARAREGNYLSLCPRESYG